MYLCMYGFLMYLVRYLFHSSVRSLFLCVVMSLVISLVRYVFRPPVLSFGMFSFAMYFFVCYLFIPSCFYVWGSSFLSLYICLFVSFVISLDRSFVSLFSYFGISLCLFVRDRSFQFFISLCVSLFISSVLYAFVISFFIGIFRYVGISLFLDVFS